MFKKIITSSVIALSLTACSDDVNNIKQLKNKVDSEMKNTIDDAINAEVKVAIDESIREAINSGLSAAALDAAVNAAVKALMSGKSWADALKDAQQACAGQGGC